MKKILFGITSLTIGGAERVLVDLANRLSDDFDVTILTIYGKGELEKQLKPEVKVLNLYPNRYADYSRLERLKISYRVTKKEQLPDGYDVYVAFLEGPITRMFTHEIKQDNKEWNPLHEAVKIAWVHNDISKVFGSGKIAQMKLAYDEKVYKQYDKIIFVSNENLKDFKKEYNEIPLAKMQVIRNYIDYKEILRKAEQVGNIIGGDDNDTDADEIYSKTETNLLTVCRLVEAKALDRFIKVHKRLESQGIHSHVYIIGDGPERNNLVDLINKLNVKKSFHLLGPKENPYPYIKKCDYFCLFSYYEGFGMVLDEAKILNKPILITDMAAKECVENYSAHQIFDNTEDGVYEGLKKILTGKESNEKKTEKKNLDSEKTRVVKNNSEESNNSEVEKNRETNYTEIEKYYDDIIVQVARLLNDVAS